MNEAILKCENLCKSFGKRQILNNVSLEVNQGDILGFIGPNGAGKTTTIKLILGLQSIDSGAVKINGYDNLKLISNMYKNIDKKRIDEVVKLVKLEQRINDKVSKYSLGMRQRLGIAQALLHKPNLLILDEPTNGLDPEGIKELRELIKDLAEKENMAIVISSHNLSELESFCNKVTIIKNGKIVETSTINEVKKVEHSYIIELDNIEDIQKIIEKKIEKISETKFKIDVDKDEIPRNC